MSLTKLESQLTAVLESEPATHTCADLGMEDLMTSFSNPNYGLGIAELRIHESCCSANDVDGVLRDDQSESSGGGDALGGAEGGMQGGAAGVGAPATWRNDTPSSGDSAISSPMTDSCLASPVFALVGGSEGAGPIGGCEKPEDGVFERKSRGEVGVLKQGGSVEGNINDTDQRRVADDAGALDDSVPQMRLALPPGWKRCEDGEGAYYWHVKSGTLQREPPEGSTLQPVTMATTEEQLNSGGTDGNLLGSLNETNIVPSSSSQRSQIGSAANRSPGEGAAAGVSDQFPIRYAVRSLGWVEIGEQELTQERSSRAVNRAIVDLSAGRRDVNDAIGRWGDGKYLYLDVDQENLSLISPGDLTVLNVQPIRTIRVWGVGRDNGRDFAYVARDRASRRYMCHVFRCEQPARHIASTLCDICKRAVAQRGGRGGAGGNPGGHVTAISGQNHAPRPTDLPNLTLAGQRGAGSGEAAEGGEAVEAAIKYDALLKNSSFPTPMDEPRKLMNCHYLGTILVSRPTGVEVLNGAIDQLNARVPAEQWIYADVTVAPSTITIADHESPDDVLAECRVRFLSFLGISVKNMRLCAFIMHTAQDTFSAHVFYCEPSAGALCKTIEAACKLRYQKCLDKSISGFSCTSPTDAGSQSDSESNSSGKALVSDAPPAPAPSLLPAVRTTLLTRAQSLRSSVTRIHSTFATSSSKATVAAESVREGLALAATSLLSGALSLGSGVSSAVLGAAGSVGGGLSSIIGGRKGGGDASSVDRKVADEWSADGEGGKARRRWSNDEDSE